MTTPLDIPKSGRHVWVFTYGGPLSTLEAMSAEDVAEALGLETAPDEESYECFDISTLGEYSFAYYLAEASGFDLDDSAEILNALHGPALLLYSRGLTPQDNPMAPKAPFKLIDRFGTPVELPPVTGIETASADGVLPQGAPPTSSARMSGMVATVVLIFLAIFVAAFVWVGG
ncbi:hypothetical protein [Celeribacter litoreus]|uniref:hypothetical protein n=1 Tax=Celeribacter litoreus TaxID=2876714 RepID=UPI001CCDDF19|nr:hypothetical protein [Celeribacter litoreus]MCA0044304.1 hypothetical protein [Celeribacter litoreus]